MMPFIRKRTLQIFLCFLCISLIPTQEAYGFWWLLGRAALSAGRMLLGRPAVGRAVVGRSTTSITPRLITQPKRLQKINNVMGIGASVNDLAQAHSLPPAPIQKEKKDTFELGTLIQKETPKQAEEAFLLGYRTFKKADYPQALLQLTSFIHAHPEHKARVFDALHWIMESFRIMKDEASANQIQRQMTLLRQNMPHNKSGQLDTNHPPIPILTTLIAEPLPDALNDTEIIPPTDTQTLSYYALTEADIATEAGDNLRLSASLLSSELTTNWIPLADPVSDPNSVVH